MGSRAFVVGSACGAILGVTAGWLLWNSSNSETVSNAQPASAGFSRPKPSESIGATGSEAAETGGGSSSEDQVSPQPNSSDSASHVRRAELDALRPMIELGYMFPELVSTLRLDAETGEGLMILLSEHLLDSRENPPFVPAGQLEWNEYDKPQWVLRQEEQQRRQNAEIAAFLGERRYGLFMDYMDTIEACRLMRRLESTLAGTLDALAVGQFQPLVTAVAEGQRRYLAEREKYASPTGLERIARFHERMREAAQPYLAPGQFAHFSQYLDAVYEAEKKRVEELYVTRGRSQLDQQ